MHNLISDTLYSTRIFISQDMEDQAFGFPLCTLILSKERLFQLLLFQYSLMTFQSIQNQTIPETNLIILKGISAQLKAESILHPL